MGEGRSAFIVLPGESTERRTLGTPRRARDDDIGVYSRTNPQDEI